jgi:hypothetical protein
MRNQHGTRPRLFELQNIVRELVVGRYERNRRVSEKIEKPSWRSKTGAEIIKDLEEFAKKVRDGESIDD